MAIVGIYGVIAYSVAERTREIGILKSLGASRLYIVDLVLRETAFLAFVGIALGIGFAWILKAFMSARFPTQPFPVTIDWMVTATLIAFCGALLGASYPALKAAAKDPIEALAYE